MVVKKKTELKGFAKKVKERLIKMEPEKTPRTLFLNKKNYEAFQEVCNRHLNRKPSQVIDEMIAVFLDESIHD